MQSKGMPKIPGSGRKKGGRNKDSIPIKEMIEKLGIDPAAVLAYFAAGDWKSLGYVAASYVVQSGSGVNEKLYIEPAVRMKAASELCRYLYPTLKAVTISKDPHDIETGAEGLSNEELAEL